MEGADEDEAAATLTETATGGGDYHPGLKDEDDPATGGAFGDEPQAAGALQLLSPTHTRARASRECPTRSSRNAMAPRCRVRDTPRAGGARGANGGVTLAVCLSTPYPLTRVCSHH